MDPIGPSVQAEEVFRGISGFGRAGSAPAPTGVGASAGLGRRVGRRRRLRVGRSPARRTWRVGRSPAGRTWRVGRSPAGRTWRVCRSPAGRSEQLILRALVISSARALVLQLVPRALVLLSLVLLSSGFLSSCGRTSGFLSSNVCPAALRDKRRGRIFFFDESREEDHVDFVMAGYTLNFVKWERQYKT